MALQKSVLNISFQNGLNQKVDPLQTPSSSFLTLENSTFNKIGRLTKRNGFTELTEVGDTSVRSLAVYANGLIGVGDNISAYDPVQRKWRMQSQASKSIGIHTLALSRGAYAQTNVTSLTNANGNTCAVYIENNQAQVQLSSNFGTYIVSKLTLGTGTSNVKIVEFQNYFVIFYSQVVGPNNHLKFIKIPVNFSLSVSTSTTISTSFASAYDVTVTGPYIAIFYSDVTETLSKKINNIFNTTLPKVISTSPSSLISCNTHWLFYYQGSSLYSLNFDDNVETISALSPQTVANVVGLTNLGNTVIIQQQVIPYASVRQDKLLKGVATTSLAVSSFVNGVGIYSKPFSISGKIYLLTSYYSAYNSTTGSGTQPTYFIYNLDGQMLGKVAPSNGGNYLPSSQSTASDVSILGDKVYIAYLYAANVQAVNKEQGANNSGLYQQTGINLLTMDFSAEISFAESNAALNLSGAQMYMYDGYNVVEQGFHLYPEYIQLTKTMAGTGPVITYYYQVCYEWTDANGNIHRSSPSIPASINVETTGSTVELKIPTLKQTNKSNVRIVIYRWSTNQQIYYQVTSIFSPLLNDPSVTYLTYSDAATDASISGNNILYTSGGVVENIAAPSCSSLTTFKSRLFLLSSEDRNLIWYSKQIIQNTPIELSDLFTIYVNSSTDSSDITALYKLDDKLIIFKENSIYYLVGNGPDNTGGANDFSEPTLITTGVGCTNQRSIVTTPDGLLFQSNKGIWQLNRSLQAEYIGHPVEDYNELSITGAVLVPATNQVRFSTADGPMLVYDYFVKQWSTFNTLKLISAIIHDNRHTVLDSYGRIMQESATFKDGSTPVKMRFETAWLNMAGIQGLERVYEMTLTGTYLKPHKLKVEIAFDYNPAIIQTIIITPTNTNSIWGGDAVWGASPIWGDGTALEQWRIFPVRQKCQAIKIIVSEIETADAGLLISNLSVSFGVKKLSSTQPARNSVG